MVYEGSKKVYDFRKFKTIRVFGDEIRNNIIDMSMENDKQNQLLRFINKFKSKTKLRHDSESEKLKEVVLNSARTLLKEREMVYKAFESKILLKPEELKKGTRLKILTTKQMPQRLPIALAQIKAGNNSESLSNETR